MEKPEGRVEPRKALYLYCIYKGEPALSAGPGIDGTTPTFTLRHRDLCGLVSYFFLDESNEGILNKKVDNPKWLIPRAKRHEEIVRFVAGFYPVTPIKFGNLFTGDEAVLEFLRNSYEPLCSFLEFVRDKEEWGLKVYADQEHVRSAAVGTSRLVRQFDHECCCSASGEAYLRRKKRQEVAQQEEARLLGTLANDVYQKVLSWSVEGRRNRPLGREATERSEEMILNGAFLVPKWEVAAFKQRIGGLGASHEANRLSFEISGPWPPYNFCPELAVHNGAATA